MTRDDHCHHISTSLTSKYFEMMVFCKHRAVTSHDMCEYIMLLSTFWIKLFNFHTFVYPLKCIPGPCDVKMDRNKQYHSQRRTPMVYYVTGYFRHSKSWKRLKIYMIKILPDFLLQIYIYMCIYNLAQIHFDFGQVYIVWWLSYSQVGKK